MVSPLLRIHNETEFSMELRFQRPERKETEYASVILKTGDTIDDCLAAFGATNLSGGLKKALVSLSVGMFCLLGIEIMFEFSFTLSNWKFDSVPYYVDINLYAISLFWH